MNSADYFLLTAAWPVDNTRVLPVFDWCPDWCAGHIDDSTSDTHHTQWFHFGPDGVVVEQTEGQVAWVCVAGVDRDADRTPEQAALLDFQVAIAESGSPPASRSAGFAASWPRPGNGGAR